MRISLLLGLRNRLSLGVYLVMLPMLLSGCWSRVEINDRLFVTAMMVDAGEKEDEFKLTLGFPMASRMSSLQKGAGGGSDSNPYMTVTKTGESIAAAYRKIQSDLSRQINWGHARVILVGDKMARRGLRPILEFALRQPSFHTKAFVYLIAGETTSMEGIIPIPERFPSEMLRELAAQRSIIDAKVRDLLLGGPDLSDGLIGRLKVEKEAMGSEKGKTGIRVINNGAGMIKDEKLIGYYDVPQMRGALLIMGRLENGLISVASPTDGKTVDLIVVQVKSKIKVETRGDRVLFRILIDAQVEVLASASDIDLQSPAQIKKLEARLNDQLKDRVVGVLEKSQRMGADVCQLGNYLDWYKPSVWKRWKADWHGHYMNDVDFKAETDAHIQRLGAERNPYWKLSKPQGEKK
ncbi:Ger(x)C family spore germination protein [Paenibacillus sp. LMG 31458]|uniref:Ger(X)C family spore germination protein n=1 Tax=Paenibacillus phytorum TaxID=2654977 RepID=A0ABX1Y2W8_9BACL|nr:Ger(x)C family spore germination protein [Paenibacillus phytorum]NOU74239.1 Ger(x)C family spore germination protein [Paenibacillus phytorum]